MSEELEQKASNRQQELSRDEISEGFALLGLETEEKRQQFRIMAQVKRPARECARIWLSGTTDRAEAEGGDNA